MGNANRSSQQDRFRKIVLAIPKYLTALTTVILAGATFTVQGLVDFFNGQIALLDAATNARAQLKAAVKAIKDNRTTNGPVVKGFNDLILSMFSNQPTVLAAFGIATRKQPAKTSEAKALAAQRNVATRKARNTMGKKQRKDVKGNVPALQGAPAPQASPAPTPAPTGTQQPVPPGPNADHGAGVAPSPQAVSPAPAPTAPAAPAAPAAGTTPHA